MIRVLLFILFSFLLVAPYLVRVWLEQRRALVALLPAVPGTLPIPAKR